MSLGPLHTLRQLCRRLDPKVRSRDRADRALAEGTVDSLAPRDLTLMVQERPQALGLELPPLEPEVSQAFHELLGAARSPASWRVFVRNVRPLLEEMTADEMRGLARDAAGAHNAREGACRVRFGCLELRHQRQPSELLAAQARELANDRVAHFSKFSQRELAEMLEEFGCRGSRLGEMRRNAGSSLSECRNYWDQRSQRWERRCAETETVALYEATAGGGPPPTLEDHDDWLLVGGIRLPHKH